METLVVLYKYRVIVMLALSNYNLSEKEAHKQREKYPRAEIPQWSPTLAVSPLLPSQACFFLWREVQEVQEVLSSCGLSLEASFRWSFGIYIARRIKYVFLLFLNIACLYVKVLCIISHPNACYSILQSVVCIWILVLENF